MTKPPAALSGKPARPVASLARPPAQPPRIAERQAVTTEPPAPEDLQSIFGDNLRAARLKLGLKQAEIAEEAGVTQQRVAMIEGGVANVTLRTMTRLAQAVNGDVTTMLRRPKSRSA